jgi:hypothetical protein
VRFMVEEVAVEQGFLPISFRFPLLITRPPPPHTPLLDVQLPVTGTKFSHAQSFSLGVHLGSGTCWLQSKELSFSIQ